MSNENARPQEYLALPPEGFARKPAVLFATGLGHSKFYEMIKQGEFPAPRKVGRASLWDVTAVREWIAKTRGDAAQA